MCFYRGVFRPEECVSIGVCSDQKSAVVCVWTVVNTFQDLDGQLKICWSLQLGLSGRTTQGMHIHTHAHTHTHTHTPPHTHTHTHPHTHHRKQHITTSGLENSTLPEVTTFWGQHSPCFRLKLTPQLDLKKMCVCVCVCVRACACVSTAHTAVFPQ